MSELLKLTGVGAKRAAALRDAGITTLHQLVHYLPRTYLDRSEFQRIEDIHGEGEVNFVAEVASITASGVGAKARLQVEVQDGTGSLILMYFNGAGFWKQRFREGQRLQVSGAVKFYGRPQIVHPSLVFLKENESPKGTIAPVYPLTEAMIECRVEHRFLQKIALETLAQVSFADPIPQSLLSAFTLLEESALLQAIHAPGKMDDLTGLFHQIKMRELLPLCLDLEASIRSRSGKGRKFQGGKEWEDILLARLPFRLTPGQKQALNQLRNSLGSSTQGVSLIQGDVGSGKTLVSVMASLQVVATGCQVAFAAPTEVLAEQHAKTIGEWLDWIGVSHVLYSGSLSREERKTILEHIQSGKARFVIGTHALFSGNVVYSDLGLVIIDEQHRFGVDQRKALVDKGANPDVILMSATPIPRTLSQSVFGDVELVSVQGKPPGRKHVESRLVPHLKRGAMMGFVRDEIAGGNQVFWVVPRITGADQEPKLELMDSGPDEETTRVSIRTLVEELRVYSEAWRVESLHGQMDPQNRREILRLFLKGQIDILVATTVIEVGIDVPGANVMVIENPDRFGLAQLHQLRGRVGRGGKSAWCFLALPKSEYAPEIVERLERFRHCHDGFELADIDLQLRGSGSLDGAAQSGFGALKYTDLMEDVELIREVRAKCREHLKKSRRIKAGF